MTTSSDLASCASMKVLNLKQDPGLKDAMDADALSLSKLLQTSMLRMTGEFLNEVAGTVDYLAFRLSQDYRQYGVLASRLQDVDVSKLNNNQRMAFFINVYNALTVDSLCHLKTLPASTLDVENFWTTNAYLIGPHTYTLDQIEHGILRGNKAHPSSGTPVLSPADPRQEHRLPNLDPRIHFALNCGAKTCPVVRVYSESNLEAVLETATNSYLLQEVQVTEGVLKLPQILEWYQQDFADDQEGMLRWIQVYVDEAASAAITDILTPDVTGPKIQYFYDWSLNTA
nr:uncharacterized protein LOC128688056 isoform X1 [Cherax quadricarinatus]